MELRIEPHRHVDVIRIAGRLDLVSSSTLKDKIRHCLSERRANLVLNLERVDFINSSGLGAMISALRDVRLADGRLVLCALPPYVDELFIITGLGKVFETFATEQEALVAFETGAATSSGARRSASRPA